MCWSGPKPVMRWTISVEFGTRRGEAGSLRLNGLVGLYGRQQAPGQLPTSKVPNVQAPVAELVGAGGSGTGVTGGGEVGVVVVVVPLVVSTGSAIATVPSSWTITSWGVENVPFVPPVLPPLRSLRLARTTSRPRLAPRRTR